MFKSGFWLSGFAVFLVISLSLAVGCGLWTPSVGQLPDINRLLLYPLDMATAPITQTMTTISISPLRLPAPGLCILRG